MPTIHQSVLSEDRTAADGAVGDMGNSHKVNLSTAFPASPHHQTSQTEYDIGNGSTMKFGVTTTSLRYFYATKVMKGMKNIPLSDYPSGVSLSYFGAPNQQNANPDGESAAGVGGSTITNSGLGPVTITLDSTPGVENPAAGLPALDGSQASVTPFSGDGSALVSETSAKMATGGLYGGGASGSGIKGKSKASI